MSREDDNVTRRAGGRAATTGLPVTANPYRPNTALWYEWRAGYIAAAGPGPWGRAVLEAGPL